MLLKGLKPPKRVLSAAEVDWVKRGSPERGRGRGGVGLVGRGEISTATSRTVRVNSREDTANETAAAVVVGGGEDTTAAVGEGGTVRVGTDRTTRRSSTRTVAVEATADTAATVVVADTAVEATVVTVALLAVLGTLQHPLPPPTPAVEGEGTTRTRATDLAMADTAPTRPLHRATIGTQPTPNPAPTSAAPEEGGVDDNPHPPTRRMLDCLV